jgi:predicted metal-dependent hydrolase
MASKDIDIPDLGTVTFTKRRASKSIRMRVTQHGTLAVSMPFFVPYATAVGFVKKNRDWAVRETQKRGSYFYDGMSVGRPHTLRIMYEPGVLSIRSQVRGNEVIIKHAQDEEDEAVQKAAKKACTRALRLQALQFLPKRLHDIALREGYSIGTITIKQLRGKWGSCDTHKNIILNMFLMELPDELIDYVLLHELAHTRQMNHGPDFWQEFETHLPHAKELRRQIRQYQPTIPARAGQVPVNSN